MYRGFLNLLLVAVLLGACFVSHAADNPDDYLIIKQAKGVTQVSPVATDKVLFESKKPVEAIEWALNHSSITVIGDGTYSVSANITIPRPNVSLVISEGAALMSTEDAEVIKVSEGHGDYYPLIYNGGHDNVNVVNFGTLNPREFPRGSASVAILYDGRNGGTNAINGGMVFSCGKMQRLRGEAVWIVDAKNMRIPLIWDDSPGNTLVLEGCDDLSIGTIAELNFKDKGNEAIDLNSYNRGIHCDLVIGTRPSEEVVDFNNSPDCIFQDIRLYGGGRVYRQRVYSEKGKRLTQKAHIATSDGSIVRSTHATKKKIKTWDKEFAVKGLFDNLPNITVQAKLTGIFEDGSKEEVLNRTYYLNLATPPLQERIPCNKGCLCARCKADPDSANP